MKYIIVQRTYSDGIVQEIPIIFGSQLTHAEIARSILLGCEELHGGSIVAAGEVSSLDLTVECSGRANSIKLDSRGAYDSELILTHDYGHGIKDIGKSSTGITFEPTPLEAKLYSEYSGIKHEDGSIQNFFLEQPLTLEQLVSYVSILNMNSHIYGVTYIINT